MTPAEQTNLCGFARADLGFIYQRFTCPLNFKCVMSSINAPVLADELFYNGYSYPALCKSFLDEDSSR